MRLHCPPGFICLGLWLGISAFFSLPLFVLPLNWADLIPLPEPHRDEGWPHRTLPEPGKDQTHHEGFGYQNTIPASSQPQHRQHQLGQKSVPGSPEQPLITPMLGSFRVRVPELSPCHCCHHPKDVAVRHAGTPTHPCRPFTMELSFLSLLLPLSHPTITPQRPPAALPGADGCAGGTVNPPERPRSAAGTAAHARNDAVPAPHPLFVFRVLHDPSEPSPALECRSAVDYKMARCKRCI